MASCSRIPGQPGPSTTATASAAAALTLLAPAVLLDDDRDVDPYQGPDIRRQRAVAGRDQYHFVPRCQRRHDLLDPGVDAARIGIDAHQPSHLVLVAYCVEGI